MPRRKELTAIPFTPRTATASHLEVSEDYIALRTSVETKLKLALSGSEIVNLHHPHP